MPLPEPAKVRNRIENITNPAMRTCLQATYLLGAARICEIVGEPLGKEKAYGPRGTDIELTQYQPTPMDEVGDWILRRRLINGEQIEPIACAVFTVKIAKRKPLPREPVPTRLVGLPLDPKYEPWTAGLVDYWQSRGRELVFPFNRSDVWRYVTECGTFDGFVAPIARYYSMRKRKVEPAHSNPFKLHALRKLRFNELRMFYRFTGEERAAYVGWTLGSLQRTGERHADMEATYGEIYHDWRTYFPKLLRSRQP